MHPTLDSLNWELVVAGVALVVSILALGISVYFWRRQFGPIITLAVKTSKGGNVATAYELVLHNSGSIPAKNIRLIALESALAVALGEAATTEQKKMWLACFAPDAAIGMLQNGDRTSCSFGFTGQKDSGFWKYGANLDIEVKYNGWFGRCYIGFQTII